MIYKKFQDLSISALGFGMMRLPTVEGNDAVIDEALAAEMVDKAMKAGVNYYDTAWGYHHGQSEIAAGHILSHYPRESFFLASKFPGYDLNNVDKVEEIFEKQLEKCGVDYFDFYLIHNVCELNIDAYLDPKYGIVDYLLAQKKAGRIRHLGFSGHGEMNVLKRFLEAYGAYMEFGQLQINYLDWKLQDAKAKVELLQSYHIPIWVMEPVRGGRLASLAEPVEKALKNLRPDESIPAWAFRFIQSLEPVVVTLSGMSTMAQVEDNLKTFEENKPVNAEERALLDSVAKAMIDQKILPCTSCRYCTSHCPMELDIPFLLKLYNEHNFTGGGFIAPMALRSLPDDKWPTACIACHSCEAVCPQRIHIPDALAAFSAMVAKKKK